MPETIKTEKCSVTASQCILFRSLLCEALQTVGNQTEQENGRQTSRST